MQKNKFYSLRIDINHIESQSFSASQKYTLKIIKDSLQKVIESTQLQSTSILHIDKEVEFIIPKHQLKRQTKCRIQLGKQGYQSKQEIIAKFQFLIMDYKNYSKKQFDMIGTTNISPKIHMSISLNSYQNGEQSLKIDSSSKETVKKLDLLEKNAFNSGGLRSAYINRTTSRNEKVQQIKNRDIKQNNKKEHNNENQVYFQQKAKNNSSINNSSLSQNISVMDNISKVNEPYDKNVKQSRYCKQIQQNLDNLQNNDQAHHLLSLTKTFNLIDQSNFFDTFHKIKDKFQKIHEHETFLNADEDIIDHTILEDKEIRNSEPYKIEIVNSPIINFSFGPSTKVSKKQNKLQINNYLNLSLAPKQKNISIFKVINDKFNLKKPNQSRDYTSISTRKKYQLAKVNNTSHNLGQQVSFRHNTCLSESESNFEVEEQSLKRIEYIRLNKISLLCKTADNSKRCNSFLIKANQQLKHCHELTQRKLQTSRKIINEKQQLIVKQFERLKDYMKMINNSLSQKNQQFLQKEQKIRVLQNQIEQYMRQINNLKNEIKNYQKTIKQLKITSACRDEQEQSMKQINNSSRNKNTANRRQQQQQSCLQISFSSEKKVNASKLFQDRKIRQKISLENDIKITQVEQNNDKSSEAGSMKSYRKFSRTNNNSRPHSVTDMKNSKNNKYSSTDFIFDTLNGLLLGDSGARILKDL